MPNFRPPLGHASKATFPSSASGTYLQLNFIASLAPNETVDGSYQLWTDIHNLGPNGEPTAAKGEWHAIPYDLVESPQGRYLVAQPVVTARLESFSYTLRLVKGNGEIIWLGSGGDNGSVSVEEGSEKEDKVFGERNGEMGSSEEVKWTGIATSLRSGSSTSLVQLPSLAATTTQLVVARGTLPFLSGPFSNLVDTPFTKIPLDGQVMYMVIASSSESLNIGPGLVIPASDPLATFCRYSSLHDAISSIRASDVKLEVQPITEKDIQDGFLSPANEGGQSFVLFRDAATATSLMVPLSTSQDPTLLKAGDTPMVISDTETPRLNLPAGLSATPITLTPFNELRESGRDDVLWIASTTGTVIEVGEEECEDDQAPIVHVPASPAQRLRMISDYNPDEGNETRDDEPSASYRTARTTQHSDGTDKKDENDSNSLSLTRFIGRLVTRLFAWLFWPFGFGKTIKPKEEDQRALHNGTSTPQGGEAQADTEAVNERTPLLSTPGLSRSTSASLFSPLASPESVATVKPSRLLPDMVDNKKGPSQVYEEGLSTNSLALSGTTTPVDMPNRDLSAPHVSVKSYIRFSVKQGLRPEIWAYRSAVNGPVGKEEVKVAVKKAGKCWVDVNFGMEPCGPGSQRGLYKVVLEQDQGKGEDVQVQVTRA